MDLVVLLLKNASIYISNVLDPQSVSTEQNYFWLMINLQS